MKAVLVIDMPKSCLDCQLMVDGWCYAVKADRTQDAISAKDRTCWCPLRPLPKWKIDGCSAFNEDGGIVYDDEVFDWVKELIE